MSPPAFSAVPPENPTWRVNRYGHWEARVGQFLLVAELHYQHYEPFVRAASNGEVLYRRQAPMGLEEAKAEAAEAALVLLDRDQETIRSLMGWKSPANRAQTILHLNQLNK